MRVRICEARALRASCTRFREQGGRLRDLRCSGRLQHRIERDGPVTRADEPREIRLGDRRQVLCFNQEDRLPRALCLDRQHIVRRHQPRVEAGPDVGQLRVHAPESLFEHVSGLARGQQGPERTCDLELQIRSRRSELLPAEFRLGARRAFERLQPPARVDRPLQLDARTIVVGHVRIDQADASLRREEAELVHVVRSLVAQLRGDDRLLRGAAPLRGGNRCSLTRAKLTEPVTVGDSTGDRVIQRQSCGRRLRLAG